MAEGSEEKAKTDSSDSYDSELFHGGGEVPYSLFTDQLLKNGSGNTVKLFGARQKGGGE